MLGRGVVGVDQDGEEGEGVFPGGEQPAPQDSDEPEEPAEPAAADPPTAVGPSAEKPAGDAAEKPPGAIPAAGAAGAGAAAAGAAGAASAKPAADAKPSDVDDAKPSDTAAPERPQDQAPGAVPPAERVLPKRPVVRPMPRAAVPAGAGAAIVGDFFFEFRVGCCCAACERVVGACGVVVAAARRVG